jgi:chitinase
MTHAVNDPREETGSRSLRPRPTGGVRHARGIGLVVAGVLLAAAFVSTAAPASTLQPDGPAVATASAVRRSAGAAHDEPRIIGYFPSWGIYERGYDVADIPAQLVTHVNYAFANLEHGRCVPGDPWADVERPSPTDDPTLPYRGNFNQLSLLKRAHPHLRTVISVGGSTWSGGFSAAASTAAGRRMLAESCVDFMHRFGFDGISIDWEYPVSGGVSPGRPEDRANFTALLVEIRAELDELDRATGTSHVLTIAGPAGAPNMANMDIRALADVVDWVNVMAYDFAGPWSPRTGHNAALYAYPGIEDATFTVDSAMQRWEAAGMPPEQLNVGLAFYGRGFGGVTTAAPGSPYRSVPMGTTEAGQFDYAHLVAGVLDASVERFDPVARVPFAHDPLSGEWYSFDNPHSITEKARYSLDNGYGGVLVWELSNDAPGNPLLRAANLGLGR